MCARDEVRDRLVGRTYEVEKLFVGLTRARSPRTVPLLKPFLLLYVSTQFQEILCLLNCLVFAGKRRDMVEDNLRRGPGLVEEIRRWLNWGVGEGELLSTHL